MTTNYRRKQKSTQRSHLEPEHTLAAHAAYSLCEPSNASFRLLRADLKELNGRPEVHTAQHLYGYDGYGVIGGGVKRLRGYRGSSRLMSCYAQGSKG